MQSHHLICCTLNPRCGHCKKLEPEYRGAASKLLEQADPPVPLAKVDATEESELAKRFDVTGYPTLKMFRKGREFEYKGGRDMWGELLNRAEVCLLSDSWGWYAGFESFWNQYISKGKQPILIMFW